MNSLILQIAARYLSPFIVFISVVILFRGHNSPGGGFIAGLFAAAGFILYAISFGTGAACKKLRINTRFLIALGLLLALGSGIPALLQHKPFLTGLWEFVDLGSITEIPLGTPVLFDCGVFFLVLGVTLTIVFSLMESE